jgi:hypothetical protein
MLQFSPAARASISDALRHRYLSGYDPSAHVRRHICAGTGLAPAAPAPGPGSPLPKLHQDIDSAAADVPAQMWEG